MLTPPRRRFSLAISPCRLLMRFLFMLSLLPPPPCRRLLFIDALIFSYRRGFASRHLRHFAALRLPPPRFSRAADERHACFLREAGCRRLSPEFADDADFVCLFSCFLIAFAASPRFPFPDSPPLMPVERERRRHIFAAMPLLLFVAALLFAAYFPAFVSFRARYFAAEMKDAEPLCLESGV